MADTIIQNLSSLKSIAICESGKDYSYPQLNSDISQLTNYLSGLKNNRRVAILLPNSYWSTVSVLSSYFSNYCYIPISTKLPTERICTILEDSEAALVITASVFTKLLPPNIDIFLCDNNYVQNHTSPDDSVTLMHDISDNNLPLSRPIEYNPNPLYIMYTSGSTGKPKGVAISRNSVENFIQWALATFDVGSSDHFSHHSHISFDLSIFDIFLCATVGAKLVTLSEIQDLSYPIKFILEHKITVWFSVPSIISQAHRSDQISELHKCESLKYMIFCGEALKTKDLQILLSHQNNITIYNLYGPTEATVACSFYRVNPNDITSFKDTVPIGKAIPPNRLRIESIRKEPGELVISGPQLSNGYWNDTTETDKKFQINPVSSLVEYFTGDICYQDNKGFYVWHGRTDSQIKINGYRIDLAGIEAIARTSQQFRPELDFVALFMKGDVDEIFLIINSLPSTAQESIIKKELQKDMNQCLPTYERPKKILFIKSFPKTQNGKIDKNRLLQLIKSNPI